tara:strand:- start:535 stop:831 length:297 start_codon:yes stop_codon:yes gene_type:complete
MADFDISGTRTTVTTITVVEKFDDCCTLEIGKKKVREYTDAPASEDGDTSVWYDYAEEAVLNGAPHKIDTECGGTKEVISTEKTVEYHWDNDLEVHSR